MIGKEKEEADDSIYDSMNVLRSLETSMRETSMIAAR